MSAPRHIPPDLKDAFTMNGQIPIYGWYINDVVPEKSRIWSKSFVQNYITAYSVETIRTKEVINETYKGATKLHLQAFEKYIDSIQNKSIAVIGSKTPWIEAILLNCGAKDVTTVEYNVPVCDDSRIKTISYTEFCTSSKPYDAVVSYSSIEHSGLGRYGEPLNPNGDIETMEAISHALKDGGLCFVGFPVGKDYLVWNAHRIYGEKRLPLLYGKTFKELEWIGCTKDYITTCPAPVGNPRIFQPIVVLQKSFIS